MTFTLSKKSLDNLKGVRSELASVVKLALTKSPIDFVVIEGLRTPERQAALKAAGASQTLLSRHLTGHAVDIAAIVDGQVRWDWPLYDRLALAMKSAAQELRIPLEWGGDWKTIKDGPHFQLPWKDFP